MVNEFNKPPPVRAGNTALGERLEAGSRQLHEMQAEHQQLLQEMATLRERASQLGLMETQQRERAEAAAEIEDQPQIPPETAELSKDDAETENKEIALETPQDSGVDTSEITPAPCDTTTTNVTTPEEGSKDEQSPADPEEVEYIRQKMTEIATLKAQYKRVQNMISTTQLIEEHIAAKNEDPQSPTTTSQPSAADHELAGTTAVDPEFELPAFPEQQIQSAIRSENVELLNTMLTMFNEFTSDLRGQADNLRAERERIRSLKEELMRRRRQP